MARPQKQSRIVKWRGRWTLFYHDYQTGKECRESVHSLTEEQRRTLLARHRQADKNQQAEVIQRGGMLAYDTDLVHALAEHYLTDVAEREAARAENPEAREGIARRSAIDIRASMRMFTGWLNQKHPRLQTGSLDGAKLKSYFSWLARQDTKRGTKTVKMSGATLNKHRRCVRAAIRFLATIRPPMFPDLDSFDAAFRPARTLNKPPIVYSPAELRAFLRHAIDREHPDHVLVKERMRKGAKEILHTPAASTASTPVSRLFILLALTGARLGEVVVLKWEDVDLVKGRITLYGKKTGKLRIFPLVGGGADMDLCPRLLELMKRWRLEAGERVYVLPHDGRDQPVYPRTSWASCGRQCETTIKPQGIRSTASSNLAAIGVPPAAAALYQGHGTEVASKFYRDLVLDREPGPDLESALGLAAILDALLKTDKGRRKRAGRR